MENNLDFKSRFKSLLDTTKKRTTRKDLLTAATSPEDSGPSAAVAKFGGEDRYPNLATNSAAAAERQRRSLLVATHPIPLTALEEDDVLATIEPEYFFLAAAGDPDDGAPRPDDGGEEDALTFDPSNHELQKFVGGTLDQAGIDVQRQRLLRQLKVVTKKAFALILEQRPMCAQEMDKVADLTGRLDQALALCRQGRRGLHEARLRFTGSSLGILAAYKRRQRAAALVENLSIIGTLQRTDERLQELLAEGNYPGAIRLLVEGQNVVATYKHFTAIQQLSVKLQDTLDLTEEQLDVALSKVCVDFDQEQYGRLVEAFGLLGSGKVQTSMDQLQMHVTSAIHNTAWHVVYGHAVLSSQAAATSNRGQPLTSTTPLGNGQNQALAEDLSKKLYADICCHVATSSLVPCLLDLCRSLWNIMDSYQRIVEFHKRQGSLEDKVGTKAEGDEECTDMTGDISGPGGLEVEEAMARERSYIEKKLGSGLVRIWQDVQTKVKILVTSCDVSGLSIDQFLKMIGVVHKLIEVGEIFCSCDSNSLEEPLKKQCLNYFLAYHLERLEDIRMHLDNESWAVCPVKPTFDVFHLQEYLHLKDRHEGGGGPLPATISAGPSPLRPTAALQLQKPSSDSVHCWPASCPFVLNLGEDCGVEEDFMELAGSVQRLDRGQEKGVQLLPSAGTAGSPVHDCPNSDEDIPEELKRDFIDEDDYHPVSRTDVGPHFTSTPDRERRRSSHQSVRPRKISSKSHKGHVNGGLPVITLTNASLMILRLFGKYLHLMRLLTPIAHDVFLAMTQLLEYYFLNVQAFFANDLNSSHAWVVSPKFAAIVQQFQKSLLRKQNSMSTFPSATLASSTSCNVSLSNNGSLPSTPCNNPNSGEAAGPSSVFNISAANRQIVFNIHGGGIASSQKQDCSPDQQGNEVGPGSCDGTSSGLGLDLASLSSTVCLSQPESLHGFPERAVGVESVAFLISQLRSMKGLLLSLIPTDCHDSVNVYFNQTMELMEEIRRPVLMAVAEKSVDSEAVLQFMSKVVWELNEVKSQHNYYVDIMLRDLQIFSIRLQDLLQEEAAAALAGAARSVTTLWEMCSLAAAFVFVEGFAAARRCNIEGRALMQLDYRHFVMKLEMTCDLKPLPYQEYVMEYIKAFYIPELEFENWVKYHTEYSSKQLMALVNCAAHSNSRTRQKLQGLISDISDKIRR